MTNPVSSSGAWLADAAIPVYPDLALALLRAGAVAAGRIWFLLRHLDRDGRGWLALNEVRPALTAPDSALHVCSARHLRTLLARGEGIFWQHDQKQDRLWLRSRVRVAAALDVERFRLRPVALPLSSFLGPIGDLRAHLYATFHAGREPGNGIAPAAHAPAGRSPTPISRQTLETISGVPRRTQQQYEQRAGVRSQSNYALGPAVGVAWAGGNACTQTIAWEHGHAHFTFHDRHGRHGPPDRTYHAWQLPNSYHAPPHLHPRASAAGGRRRLNRTLADLRQQGDVGNGRDEGEATWRRYYAERVEAGRAWSRGRTGDHAVYWPEPGDRVKGRIWYVLPPRQEV